MVPVPRLLHQAHKKPPQNEGQHHHDVITISSLKNIYHLNIFHAFPDQAMNEGSYDRTATITPRFYHFHHAVRIDIWFQQREQQWYVDGDRSCTTTHQI
mmetsp:Transcript_10616/g.21683  ORF Transcript_10616/g.21683 Transcript_10616/m.21683 type:complete len:99 (-) Transcript_10616:1242-1538(-)